MLSRRLPGSSAPNPWARLRDQRAAAGARLFDLTEANPTRVGLGGAGEGELAALADPRGAAYAPDPRGAPAAREAVCRYYAERGSPIAPEDVVLTSGTSESYVHLFRLLCDCGDEILVPSPSYPLLEPLAALEEVTLRPYRLAYDGRWHLDLDSLERAIGPRSRAIVVVQPNHPTGSCLDAAERAAVEAACERHRLSLIADEVFGDFPWPARGPGAAGGEAPVPGPDAVSRRLPSLLDRPRAPSFVLSGLSKVCGMPQLKLGWIAAAGPEPGRRQALAGLEWIADLFLSVGTPVQLALPRLLAARHDFRARVDRRIAANLRRLGEGIARRPELTRLAADGGWVAILGLPRRREEEQWALDLLRRDVVVHPGHFYDLPGPSLVLSLIVEPEVLGAGLARLEELLAEA